VGDGLLHEAGCRQKTTVGDSYMKLCVHRDFNYG